MIREKITLYGQVQGVGLRYRAFHAAGMCRITGFAENLYDGSVRIEAQAESRAEIDRFLTVIGSGNFIEIMDTERTAIPVVEDETEFTIHGY